MSTKKENKKNMNSNPFRQAALDSMSMSRLHEGREKLETEDIVGKPLTIEDFDIAVMGDGTAFAVFTFTEQSGKYYNGGLVLTKMVQAWCDMYGSLESAVEAYKNEVDKVTIQLTMGKVKSDKTKSLVTVDIL